MTQLAIAEKINEVEKYMLDMPQVDCPVGHYFGPNVYIREVRIPAGTFAVGHRQKTKHLNVFLQGSVLMTDDDGQLKQLDAPMIFESEPGRKIGFILTDVVWLNVYSTSEQDVEKLEAMFLDKSPAALNAEQERLRQQFEKEVTA